MAKKLATDPSQRFTLVMGPDSLCRGCNHYAPARRGCDNKSRESVLVFDARSLAAFPALKVGRSYTLAEFNEALATPWEQLTDRQRARTALVMFGDKMSSLIDGLLAVRYYLGRSDRRSERRWPALGLAADGFARGVADHTGLRTPGTLRLAASLRRQLAQPLVTIYRGRGAEDGCRSAKR